MSVPELKYPCYFCFVSGQVDPNVLPLYKKELSSAKVILLSTAEMKEEAEKLREAVKAQWTNRQVEIRNLHNDDDIESLLNQLINIFSDYPATDVKPIVNISGGKKTMTIAGIRACEVAGFLALYLDRDKGSGQLIFDNKGKLEFTPFPIPDISENLKSYLKFHGFGLNVNNVEIEERGEEAIQNLLKLSLKTKKYKDRKTKKNITKVEVEHLPLLNHFAEKAQVSLRCDCSSDCKNDFSKIEDLLTDPKSIFSVLERLGYIKFIFNNLTKKIESIQFNNEQDRKFLNGQWLELYTKSIVEKAEPLVSAQNIELINKDGRVINEIDVAFLYENRLHIIEVKTAKDLKREVTYKLDSVSKDFGGLNAKKMLVSYQPLDKIYFDELKNKNITLITGHSIKNEGEFMRLLKEWIHK